MVDQHLECNKLETLTPAQVQNSGQKITYNHNNLVHIKKEIVKDKRYKRLDFDNKVHKEVQAQQKGTKREVKRGTNKARWIQIA